MYNRYVPGSNGTYERRTVPDPPEACPPPPVPDCLPEEKAEQQQAHSRQNVLFGFDLGDLLLLCIVMLLLIDSDEEEILPILIMVAAFLMQQ